LSESRTYVKGTTQVKEGEPFAAGDVLLSIETDKAEVDVEAQDDGMLGKILVSRFPSSLIHLVS
jgi:pyruvate/2-oxoglutarate dehydrogenase complex dihydrolipoamide acyltransferase (E2) component